MADPFTMAAVTTGTQVAGGLLQAQGQAQEGAATASMFRYRAGVARMNKKIAEQNSDYALSAGETNAMRSGLQTKFILGKQTVAQGANGFDVNSGTAVDTRDSTQALGYMDQRTIREEAGRKALGYRYKAASDEAEAVGNEMSARNTERATKFKIASTILGTAGSVAGKWYQAGSSFGGASSGVTTYGPDFTPTGWSA